MRFAFGATAAADPALAAHTVAEQLDGGKFENLNRVLSAAALGEADWLLVVDDDVRLPAGFLDRFLALCEHFQLDLAQPAQSQRSHSAWRVTRRRPGLARARDPLRRDRPGDRVRAGAPRLSCCRSRSCASAGGSTCTGRRWPPSAAGASAWSTPRRVRHEAAPVGSSYSAADAQAEAGRFLADRPYLPAARAGEVLATHRRVAG